MVDLRIQGAFTTLNQYVEAERTHRMRAAVIKRDETERVKLLAAALRPIKKYPVEVWFTWTRADARSDPDNIAFAAKFLMDGLVAAGVLAGDGWKQIKSIRHDFALGESGVRVVIREVRA